MALTRPSNPALKIVGDADGSVYIESRGGERLWRVEVCDILVSQENHGVPEILIEALGGRVD